MGEANRFRTFWIAAVILLVLVTILGARNMASDRQYTDFDFDLGTGRMSVHKLIATVPREEWDTYFDKMREFAKANDLKIRVKRFRPGFDIFFVDLWRSDVLLLGGNVFNTPKFQTYLYVDPDKGGTPEVAAALVDSMKEFVSQVPGITIKQTK